MIEASFTPTPLEQMLGIGVVKRKLSIGIPAPNEALDRLFPLTPEAAGMLVERGFQVKMQQSGAQVIHYDDLRYQQYGVDIVDRKDAFRSDIVICLSPISPRDTYSIRRGALILSLSDSLTENVEVLRLLMRNHVITLGLDLIVDEIGHKPFADILAEIAGRASMAMASALLADSVHGKGILLGGVAGIVPCEVTILGSGIDACSAARSALGLGAMVRMFDNDVYRLRSAIRVLGPGVVGSAIHPRVLLNALRTADVVVATKINPHHVIGMEVVNEMKRGVITFDLGQNNKPVFPSLRQVDLGIASPSDNDMSGQRVCYINPGNAVPRTVAMAISNTLLTMITEIFTCDGVTNALMLNEGLQRAVMTFLGKPVNADVASMLGMRQVDIKLMLQFS